MTYANHLLHLLAQGRPSDLYRTISVMTFSLPHDRKTAWHSATPVKYNNMNDLGRITWQSDVLYRALTHIF